MKIIISVHDPEMFLSHDTWTVCFFVKKYVFIYNYAWKTLYSRLEWIASVMYWAE